MKSHIIHSNFPFKSIPVYDDNGLPVSEDILFPLRWQIMQDLKALRALHT